MFLFLALLLPSPAFAYIDPGSGALLVQALVGAVFSALAAAALWWRNLRAWLARFGGKRGGTGGDDA